MLPRLACLNMHPSLLPAYRGPVPVFWQLRNAEPHTGVTLHRLSDELDAGDVLAQVESSLSDGLDNDQINRQLGRTGAELLLRALPELTAARASYTEQDERRASYQPLPQAQDFTLDTGWSSRHAFNFVRATEHWCRPYKVRVHGRTLLLKRAIRFTGSGSQVREANGAIMAIPFRRGVLYAERLAGAGG